MAHVISIRGLNIDEALLKIGKGIRVRGRDETTPINVYMSSPGGSIAQMYQLIRIVNKTPNILIIFVGLNSSAAAIMYHFIEPGKKTTVPDFSRFMYHRPMFSNSVSMNRHNSKCLEYIVSIGAHMQDIISKYILDDESHNRYCNGEDVCFVGVDDINLKMVTLNLPKEIDELPLYILDMEQKQTDILHEVSEIDYPCELNCIGDLYETSYEYVHTLITTIHLNPNIKSVLISPANQSLSLKFLNMNLVKPRIHGVIHDDKFIILLHNISIDTDVRVSTQLVPFEDYHLIYGGRPSMKSALEECGMVNTGIIHSMVDFMLGTPMEHIEAITKASVSGGTSLLNISPNLIPYRDYLYNKYKICLYYPEEIYNYMCVDENGIAIKDPTEEQLNMIKDIVVSTLKNKSLIKSEGADIAW